MKRTYFLRGLSIWCMGRFKPAVGQEFPQFIVSGVVLGLLRTTVPAIVLVVSLSWQASVCAEESATSTAVELLPASQTEVADEPKLTLSYIHQADPNLETQIAFLNDLIRFAQPVKVLTEVDQGPLFDPDSQEIWIPGFFADNIQSYFEDEDAPVADVYFHTLLHEVAHVLFSHYDLPLLAREEDAADAMASVLLLEYVENGARIALNAAEMFGLESEEYEWFYDSDFWSEHSLDIQRYYATLCHVYGSDPEGQAALINDEYGLSPDRAGVCIDEYQRVSEGWLTVLAPYLKR